MSPDPSTVDGQPADGRRADPATEVAKLYGHENRTLVGWLKRRTRCRTRAEDLAHTAWLKLYAAARAGRCDLSDAGGLRAVLYTIARNTFLDEYGRKHAQTRTRTCDPSLLEDLVPGSEPGALPEEDLETAQRTGLLRAALATLPDEQRLVVTLWAHERPARRMAAASGAPVDTVNSRRKYAFARLRRELAPALAEGGGA